MSSVVKTVYYECCGFPYDIWFVHNGIKLLINVAR